MVKLRCSTRAHDCITLFLGSREAYNKAFYERPGTFYLTPGWVAENNDPIGFMERKYVPRYGRETAIWALKEELKHYTHIVLINNKVSDTASLQARAMENARFLEKKYEEMPGTLDYFRKIIYGPYHKDDFILMRERKKPLLLRFINQVQICG